MGYVRGEETHKPGKIVSEADLNAAYGKIRTALPEPRWGSTRYETHAYATTEGPGPIVLPALGPDFEVKAYENKDGTRTIAIRTTGSRGWYRGSR